MSEIERPFDLDTFLALGGDLSMLDPLTIAICIGIVESNIDRNLSQGALIMQEVDRLSKLLLGLQTEKTRLRGDVNMTAPDDLGQTKRDHVLRVLQECRWVRTTAAKRLGISRHSLVRLLAAFRSEGVIVPESRHLEVRISGGKREQL
jgi:hypothetical protein